MRNRRKHSQRTGGKKFWVRGRSFWPAAHKALKAHGVREGGGGKARHQFRNVSVSFWLQKKRPVIRQPRGSSPKPPKTLAPEVPETLSLAPIPIPVLVPPGENGRRKKLEKTTPPCKNPESKTDGKGWKLGRNKLDPQR